MLRCPRPDHPQGPSQCALHGEGLDLCSVGNTNMGVSSTESSIRLSMPQLAVFQAAKRGLMYGPNREIELDIF